MCLTEFNEKVFVKSIREEGFEEGIEEGRLKVLRAMITKRVSKAQALEYGFTEEEYDEASADLCAITN